MIKLYELSGKDKDVLFSPFVWRIRFALLHKGLDYETMAWQPIEKSAIAPTGQGKVPVLVDGEDWVNDSWNIAVYLDEKYQDKPLMPSGAKGVMHGFNQMVDNHIHPLFRPLILVKAHDSLDAENQKYFRDTREKMLGQTLEAACAHEEKGREDILNALAGLAPAFNGAPYLGGEQPDYADYIVMGELMWVRILCAEDLLPTSHALYDWQENMLDLHDGHARKGKLFKAG